MLNTLHSAHQGVTSMTTRARGAVYWPGIDADIRNKRYTCQRCNEMAPSQSKEPLSPSPSPLYPYQMICLDYFDLGHHTYLICVDRFSGWIIIHHYPNGATARQLISSCRSIFTSYGVAEDASTDGGPQFKSHEFEEFLKHWGVKHRLSSAYYPQSNGRAELAVKAAKRIIRDNTLPNGSLDSDKATRALLQHRNTPLADLGMSPAQLLLHRSIRDHIPVNPTHYELHKDWILSADERERLYARRDEAIRDSYNATAHPLAPLAVQTLVMIQTKGKWDKSGRVIEALPHRQYRIRVDGSGRVTLRNRRFLRQVAENSMRAGTALPLPSGPTASPSGPATFSSGSATSLSGPATPPSSPAASIPLPPGPTQPATRHFHSISATRTQPSTHHLPVCQNGY